MGRRIYKRADTGQWDKVDAGFPVIESDTDQGFSDLDAFSDQDIYAVGGQGDVWRYDGHKWNMCGFPSNEQLSTVVCAPDGNVYIGGEGGNIWVGRKNTGREYMKARQRYYGMKCVGLRENYGLHQITC
ncbi:hypothetical protein FTV92_12950 [Escherichia coli]|nr:hypothetical protein FTV92_12950 [Escherichia coli]